MTEITAMIDTMARHARQAARELASSSGELRNQALAAMATQLEQQQESLIAANHLDLDAALDAGLSTAMLDRLKLTSKGIAAMAEGLRQILQLPDPVGEITEMRRRPNGMMVGRMRMPLGVIGIIYESRPNVTADAAGLCVKSGNAVILRGGSEAFHSNRAIAACLGQALTQAGLPQAAVQCIATTDRAAVGALLRCEGRVDVIIPRGGKELIARIVAESRIPVIKHLDGNCHTYVDDSANLTMAAEVTFNAKMQRTGVCNATETLLVHQAIAAAFLPGIAARLVAAGCELRGCPRTRQAIGPAAPVHGATQTDWETEFLAPILAIRVVDGLEQALDHIETYSSRHTEAIITQDHGRAMRFLREVDSAAVMVNASTRFNDGFQFGLGAEMGISTDKLHVRGPVGLEGLTSLKYVVLGEGQLRQ